MLFTDRQKKLLEYLDRKKHAKNSELCSYLFCSISSLRRDLIHLERNGLAKRTYGGAVITPKSNMEFSHFYRETENNKEKYYISTLALDFIGNGMSIFLDSSSTSYYICELLKNYHNIIVVTNGLRNAISLSNLDNVKVYIPGGELKTGSTSILGELSGSFIENFKADICFVSCRGLDHSGVYEASLNQALFKRHMMENSKETILLCDSSKFESSHFFKLTDFYKISNIISNKEPSEKYIKLFKQYDIELFY